MKSNLLRKLGLVATVSLASWSGIAQESAAVSAASAVPKLVNYSGVLNDVSSKPLSSVAGVTFLLYKEQQGGTPLWIETQNVQPDKTGHFTVTLGATKSEGLPVDVFTNGEARWLAVRVTGQTEQPRVLLVAVPYAIKAGDAETVGGLPPSAFLLAAPVNHSGAAGPVNQFGASSFSNAPPANLDVTTTGGTVNTLPLWTTATNVQSSAITQTGSGATAKIGIGTTMPAVALDVKGAETVRGALTLPATGTATTTAGKNSQPESQLASSYNSSTKAAVSQTFQWVAEPAANNTASPSGTLNLRYGLGAALPGETGLKIGSSGLFTFAAGQTFPGTGSGTVTSVALTAPLSDFAVTGSPVTTAGTLNVNWLVAPTSANTANAIVKRDASGNIVANDVTFNTVSINTSAGVAITANSSASGATTILGEASAITGPGWGVEGFTASGDTNAIGVYGYAPSSTGSGIGVKGYAGSTAGGVGVYGQIVSASVVGSAVTGAGVWGDTGQPEGNGNPSGVLATADDNMALVAINNSANGHPAMFVNNEEATNPANSVFSAAGYIGECIFDVSGNLFCTGSKSAVVPVDGGTRKVALYAIEGAENWFEDAGGGELVNGSTIVRLEPTFAQTVNTNVDYRVFLTPKGDCKGLYVSNEGPASFEVHEMGGGISTIAFDYRIMAKRKGYENIRLADRTKLSEVHALARRPVSFAHASAKPALPRIAGSPAGQLTSRPIAAK